jgi:hypothetical protein
MIALWEVQLTRVTMSSTSIHSLLQIREPVVAVECRFLGTANQHNFSAIYVFIAVWIHDQRLDLMDACQVLSFHDIGIDA